MDKACDFFWDWLEGRVWGSVRRSTYFAYRRFLVNYIVPWAGARALDELDAEAVRALVKGLTGRLSPKSIRSVVSVLNGAFNVAVESGSISKNPCDTLKLPKVCQLEVRAYTRKEQAVLEQAIFDSGDKRHIGIIICLYTGLRIGELCALKWENVDLDNGCLAVKHSLNRVPVRTTGGGRRTEMVEEEPKTSKSKRLIPMPEFLRQILVEHRLTSNSRYVISMPKGGFVQPRTLQASYRRLLARTGLDYIKFHSLRHTFATRALELASDIKTVSDILGHTNSAITLNRYAHSMLEQKRKTMQSLNALFVNK